MTPAVSPALAQVDDILTAFDLEQVDDLQWRGGSVRFGSDIVFGGQLIGQAVLAATAAVPAKHVKSIHTVFARAGSSHEPVKIDVERLHEGRALGSVSVTIRQAERLLSRSSVLLDAGEADLIRHSIPMPAVPGPADAAAQPATVSGWHYRFVDDADVDDPDQVGPPELAVWTRFVVAKTEPPLAQALLGWASDGFLIGTAMRPHAGVGQSQSHRELSTGVLTHTLTFHDAFEPAQWLLLAHRCDFTGAGRAYGHADVFAEDGRLVAGFVQEAMIRRMPSGRPAL